MTVLKGEGGGATRALAHCAQKLRGGGGGGVGEYTAILLARTSFCVNLKVHCLNFNLNKGTTSLFGHKLPFRHMNCNELMALLTSP